jgi:hypothetical protein
MATADDCDVDTFAGRDGWRPKVVDPPKPAPRWRFAREVVADIERLKDQRPVPLTLGRHQLLELEPGGIAVVVAAAKRGKTSCVICMLLEHAYDRGPAIACSLELPAREFVSRAIGTRTDTSWRGVLHGGVTRDRMLEVLPDRFAVIDRANASLAALRTAIDDLALIHPNQPILCGVDYLQLVQSDERDPRAKVDDVMRKLDALARDTGAVIIALSQSSRGASRQLADGSRIGAEAADAGAESASIERWATAIIALGQASEDEGTGSVVELSIAAQRMDRGDVVETALYQGVSGRWTIIGATRTASEVREEREVAKNERLDATLEAALIGATRRSPQPLSRTQLLKLVTGNNARKGAALRRLTAIGADIADVMQRAKKSKRGDSGWLVWAPDLAAKANIPLAPRELQTEMPTP